MSIQDKEQYLLETKELIKQGINNIGGELTNQSTFRSYKNGLDNIYSNLPKITAEGIELNVTPTKKGVITSRLKGNTEQASYTGKNLFNKNDASSIENAYINSTNSTIVSNANARSLHISIKPNTTYTVSRKAGQRFIIISATDYAIGTVGTHIVYNHTESSITITTGANDTYLVVFYYLSTADTLTEEEIRNSIQIEPGQTATSYEPYVGGIASPNPQFPQNIHVVTGNNTMHIGNTDYPINLGSMKLADGDEIFKNIPTNPHYDSTLIESAWYKYWATDEYLFTGEETNVTKSTATANTMFQFRAIQDVVKIPENNNSRIGLFSNYFIERTANGVYGNDVQKIGVTTTGTLNIGMGLNSEINTPTLFKQWAANKLLIRYPLATPRKVQITDETLIAQLEAIEKAKSNEGQTNIIQINADLPFIINASMLKANPTGTISITTNGTHDVSNYENANVNVQPTLQSKSLTITQNGTTTIEPDAGYDGLEEVEVTIDVGGSKPVLPDGVRFGSQVSTLTDYSWLADVDGSELTTTESMFLYDSYIQIMGLLDTSNVTNMSNMFSNCTNLQTVPLLDTSSAIRMSSMFYNCSSLQSIPAFDTSSAQFMTGFCSSCTNLVNVPQYNLSSLQSDVSSYAYNMFYNCSNLSNESLNNILASCISYTNARYSKTLKALGLTQTQAETCMTLSNYNDFVAAGWSTGY